jgi:hypothetical protein
MSTMWVQWAACHFVSVHSAYTRMCTCTISKVITMHRVDILSPLFFVKYRLFEIIVGVLKTCHTQYTWDKSICISYLIEQHSKFLLHTLQVLYMCTVCDSTNINTIIEFVPNCL